MGKTECGIGPSAMFVSAGEDPLLFAAVSMSPPKRRHSGGLETGLACPFAERSGSNSLGAT